MQTSNHHKPERKKQKRKHASKHHKQTHHNLSKKGKRRAAQAPITNIAPKNVLNTSSTHLVTSTPNVENSQTAAPSAIAPATHTPIVHKVPITQEVRKLKHTPIYAPYTQNKKHPTRWLNIYLALFMSGLFTIWYSQNSINAYWQQTYHQTSPLEWLNQYTWWKQGQYAQASTLSIKEKIAHVLDQASERWNSATQPKNITPPTDSISAAELIQANNQSTQKQTQDNTIINNTSLSTQPTELLPTPATEDSPPHLAEPETPITHSEDSNHIVLTTGDSVFFAGDSLMQGIAPHIQRYLKQNFGITSINLSKQSTGLSYPNFYDWPKVIEDTLNENPAIRLMIIFLGPNDPWDFPNPDQPGSKYLKFQSTEWEKIYRQRIQRIIQAAQAHHVHIIWLEVPPMKNNRLNHQMQYLNQVFASELTNNVLWLPTQPLLGQADGGYTDYVNINHRTTQIRSKDGIHFTISGQKYLANYITQHIQFQAASTVPEKTEITSIEITSDNSVNPASQPYTIPTITPNKQGSAETITPILIDHALPIDNSNTPATH